MEENGFELNGCTTQDNNGGNITTMGCNWNAVFYDSSHASPGMMSMPTDGKPNPAKNGAFSSAETASYSMDMLKTLKIIAERQQHRRLAELLDAAASEAERLAQAHAESKSGQ